MRIRITLLNNKAQEFMIIDSLRKSGMIAVSSVAVLATFGVATVSYDSLIPVLLGFLVGAIVVALTYLLVKTIVGILRKRVILGVLAALVTLSLSSILAFYAYDGIVIYRYGICSSRYVACAIVGTPFKEHTITIYPVDIKAGRFSVDERLIFIGNSFADFPTQHVQIPRRDIQGQSSGFFLQKLVVPGPGNRKIEVKTRDGAAVTSPICGYYCLKISIELIGIAKNAFYAAATSIQPSIPEHPDPVDISWEIPSFYSGRDKDVVFWYHPSESSTMLTLLAPFIGIASFSGFFLAVIGLFISLVVSPFLLPALQDIIKEWVKARL